MFRFMFNPVASQCGFAAVPNSLKARLSFTSPIAKIDHMKRCSRFQIHNCKSSESCTKLCNHDLHWMITPRENADEIEKIRAYISKTRTGFVPSNWKATRER